MCDGFDVLKMEKNGDRIIRKTFLSLLSTCTKNGNIPESLMWTTS